MLDHLNTLSTQMLLVSAIFKQFSFKSDIVKVNIQNANFNLPLKENFYMPTSHIKVSSNIFQKF